MVNFTYFLVLAVLLITPPISQGISYYSCFKQLIRPLPPLPRPPPPPPPPSSLSSAGHSFYKLPWIVPDIVCRDVFRVVYYSLKITGKLPPGYVEDLCKVFENDEAKVENYIKRTHLLYDFETIMGGRSCAHH